MADEAENRAAFEVQARYCDAVAAPVTARVARALGRTLDRAMAGRPLGGVMMEPDRDLHRDEVRVRGWPGATRMELVALAHAHGGWGEGLAPPYATRDCRMRGGGPAG